MRRAFFATAFILAAAINLLGATLAGFTLPDATDVGSKKLVLNGMGLRTKMMFKVYVGGLYLEQKSGDASAILKADAPKRVVMQMHRDLSRDQMVEAFTEQFEANNPAWQSMKADIDKMLGAFEPVKTGQQMVFTYQPGTGTTLAIGGADKMTIPGHAFAQAMFACWLGPKPPSADLKKGILGG